jgi:hypothetical protein
MVAYILNNLDHDFDPIVSAVMARVKAITVAELYSQLLSFENRIDLKNEGGSNGSSNGSASYGVNNSSSYVVNRGRGGGHNRGGEQQPSWTWRTHIGEFATTQQLWQQGALSGML